MSDLTWSYRRGWHMGRDEARLVVARRRPARFDVEAQTRLPSGARRGRLAHQVRQDVWRALRHLRGFAPVVEVTRTEGALVLRAGGQVAGAVPPGAADQIAQVLECPANRARWGRI